jgi:hypothetical protein
VRLDQVGLGGDRLLQHRDRHVALAHRQAHERLVV